MRRGLTGWLLGVSLALGLAVWVQAQDQNNPFAKPAPTKSPSDNNLQRIRSLIGSNAEPAGLLPEDQTAVEGDTLAQVGPPSVSNYPSTGPGTAAPYPNTGAAGRAPGDYPFNAPQPAGGRYPAPTAPSRYPQLNTPPVTTPQGTAPTGLAPTATAPTGTAPASPRYPTATAPSEELQVTQDSAPTPPTEATRRMPTVRSESPLQARMAQAQGLGDRPLAQPSAEPEVSAEQYLGGEDDVPAPATAAPRLPAREAFGREPLPQREPLNREPLNREPLDREPANREPLSRDPQAFNEQEMHDEEAQPRPAGRMNGNVPVDERVLFSRQTPILNVETAGPRRIVIGKEAAYKVTLKNAGNSPARDVLVSVKVPEWAEIVGADAKTNGFVSRTGEKLDTVQWSLKRLEANAQEDLMLRVIPRQGLPFDLAVQLSHSPVASQASVEVSEPKLNMSISGPPEVEYGKQEVFRLILSNPGTADAENVELKLAPANPGEPAPPAHKLGLLAAGEKKVVELELTARQGGTLKIQAVASAGGGLKAEATENVLIRKPDLRLAVNGPKFRYTGTPGNYRVRITNPGNAPARNVQIVALIPPGAKFLHANDRGVFDAERGKIAWRISSLEAGSEQVVSFKCELGEAGPTRFQTACAADAGLKDSASYSTDVEAIADLQLSVEDPRGPIPCGEEIAYQVKITNRGTRRAEGVEVSAFLSAGLQALPSGEGHPYRISSGQVAFEPIDVIGPGQELQLLVKATSNAGGNHLFRAELKCQSLDTNVAEEECTRFFPEDNGTPAEEDFEVKATDDPLAPAPPTASNGTSELGRKPATPASRYAR